MYTYRSIHRLSKECFEDEVNENKTENVKESLEPVDVDKAGSEASEEGTHGLIKMFALLGYCTEFLNPGTTRICPVKKITLTMGVCPMKKLETLRRNLMILTTSLNKLEQLN